MRPVWKDWPSNTRSCLRNGEVTANTTRLPWWERQGLPWWERGYSAPPPRKQDDDSHHRRRSSRRGSAVVLVPYPVPIVEPRPIVDSVQVIGPPADIVTRAPEPPPTGWLRLEVEPLGPLQIFVDDVYLGMPHDFGNDIDLAPGVHRIALRATGYRTLEFDAEIVADRTITYRGGLEPVPSEPAVSQPPVAATPKQPDGPMYLIPGCYLGNVSPKEVTLPAGCDISKMTIIPQ